MVILPILAFSVLFIALVLDILPDPKKSPEEELGAAIAKYLSKGVKVRIEKEDG